VYDPFEELLPDGFASQFETLGEEWAIAEHYFKPYPSCRYTHPPLDALREAIDGRAGDGSERSGDRQAIDPADVEAITVRTFANATDMSHAEPETMTAGKFSAPYVLGDVPLSGSVDLDHFTAEALADETVQSVAARVELREDDGYEAAFPESWGASVVVELRDGTTLTGARDYPPGRLPRPHSRRGVSRSEPCAPGARARRGGNITPESTRRSTPSTRSRSARSGRRSTRSDRNTEQTFCWTERTRQILHPAMRSVEYGTRRHTEHGIGRSDRRSFRIIEQLGEREGAASRSWRSRCRSRRARSTTTSRRSGSWGTSFRTATSTDSGCSSSDWEIARASVTTCITLSSPRRTAWSRRSASVRR